MDSFKKFWASIPRKLKYTILTLVLFGIKQVWPAAPLPDLGDILLLGGGGLVGGHIITDVAHNLGGLRGGATSLKPV